MCEFDHGSLLRRHEIHSIKKTADNKRAKKKRAKNSQKKNYVGV